MCFLKEKKEIRSLFWSHFAKEQLQPDTLHHNTSLNSCIFVFYFDKKVVLNLSFISINELRQCIVFGVLLLKISTVTCYVLSECFFYLLETRKRKLLLFCYITIWFFILFNLIFVFCNLLHETSCNKQILHNVLFFHRGHSQEHDVHFICSFNAY